MYKPIFKIEYNQKDITTDVSNQVLNIEYTDFEHGQSDEITITFEDTQKLWHKYNIPLTISIAQSKSHMHLTFCRKRHFHSVISETDNSTLKPHLHGVCFS